mmetsp:Transcript_32478/g.51976  ORF Transcript_32478/g.51976 Transcript_32478/m.51976 type:complete len:481 (+) Transcript_32478:363-1805(+)
MPCSKYVGRNLDTSSRLYPNVICVRSLVPKEKNSASEAIWSDRRAARGISIIVPTRYATVTFFSANTAAAVSRIIAVWCRSSATVPTSGTMMSGCTSPPAACTAHAASIMARTCMRPISGYVMARRHPRKPSMGLISASFSMRSTTSFSSAPVSAESRATISSSSPSGRNSCSGGSSRRMVTGSPSMARKMPSKSPRWNGSKSASAASRSGVLPAMIIRRTVRMRSPDPKNMCSVRTSPMPSAPFSRAVAASSGVSALASTLRRRKPSTQDMNSPRSPLIAGGARSAAPLMTSPVVPLRLSQSPSCSFTPPSVSHRLSSSTTSSEQPDTHTFPQPRATTAAWLVMPPRAVRIPSDAFIPPTSSGDVSTRTRITFLPAACSSSAVGVSNTTCPTAAPGEAGRPTPMTSAAYAASSLNCGCSSWSMCVGSTSSTAFLVSIMPAATRSTAIFTAPAPVRFPLRVCNMYSVPSCTVNSMSCMSL